MMSEGTKLNRSAVESLSGKLNQLAETLPEQEKNVLGWILHRAQAASEAELSDSQLERVAGGQSGTLSRDLSEAVGFDAIDSDGESTINVGWAYKFSAMQ